MIRRTNEPCPEEIPYEACGEEPPLIVIELQQDAAERGDDEEAAWWGLALTGILHQHREAPAAPGGQAPTPIRSSPT